MHPRFKEGAFKCGVMILQKISKDNKNQISEKVYIKKIIKK